MVSSISGVELEKLSPGTKGIVLLILYLGIDIADTRPLIVDQPDENLDKESIYALLTAYFKAAKNRRQIVLITHNPNLVVNGDSEQIIVATAERRADGLPHIVYSTGALEDTREDGTGIREQVCRILEGGTDALRKRGAALLFARVKLTQVPFASPSHAMTSPVPESGCFPASSRFSASRRDAGAFSPTGFTQHGGISERGCGQGRLANVADAPALCSEGLNGRTGFSIEHWPPAVADLSGGFRGIQD